MLAKPLYDLLKKDTVFSFDQNHFEAFTMLKEKLVSSPTLAIFNPTSETELHTDACKTGLGAMLFQRQEDGQLHPVSYYSKRTTDCESRYHSFELETLAIIYALQRFHIYVHGIQIKLVTDCDSLRMALSKKEECNRINRDGRFYWKITTTKLYIEQEFV